VTYVTNRIILFAEWRSVVSGGDGAGWGEDGGIRGHPIEGFGYRGKVK
jgi:hypothetical protein